MFVPFVFSLEVMSDYDHYGPFLKYVEMSCRYGWPIIAHERYFEKLQEDGIVQSIQQLEDSWGGGAISEEEASQMAPYPIPSILEKEIVSRYPSQMDAWVDLLKNPNRELEEFTGSVLDRIADDCEEPIEGILCFFVPAYLKTAAAKRNIRIFSNEQAAVRPPFYKAYTAYVESNVYGIGELRQRYECFLSEPEKSSMPLLSREGIFRLFVNDEYAQDVKLIDSSPEYEIGLLMNPRYGLQLQYSYMGNEELVLSARRQFSDDSICIRSRRGFTNRFHNDDSLTSFHFSCKCRRIAAVQSNGLFEAMLIGRKTYGYGKHPFSFMENNGLCDNSIDIAPLEFLNYVVFAYFVPFDWIIEPEYLRFRLSNPPETEIYLRGFEHWTKGISAEDLAFYYTGNGYEYRLGDTLYFESGHLPHQYAPYYFVEGFSIQEDGFIWSLGSSSVLRFDLGRQLDEQPESDLIVSFDIAMVYCDPAAEQYQDIDCSANGETVGKVHMAPGVELLEFKIPRHTINETGRLELKLSYGNPAQPPDDSRELAVAFKSVKISQCKP
jgi:hypothetical protein